MPSVQLLPVIHLPTPRLQFAIAAIATTTKDIPGIIVCFFPLIIGLREPEPTNYFDTVAKLNRHQQSYAGAFEALRLFLILLNNHSESLTQLTHLVP